MVHANPDMHGEGLIIYVQECYVLTNDVVE